MPSNITTEVTGIFQSDVIIRSAILTAIAELRASPWLLDYVFASLPKDQITKVEYGEKQVATAKKWFMSTNIPVFMVTRNDDIKLPAISISLIESTEAENTFSDTHYQVSEANAEVWLNLSDRFTPVSYSAATGVMKVPESLVQELILAPGMSIIDATGKEHEILEVTDATTVVIKAGTVASFTDAVVRSARPSAVTTMESVVMKEVYAIGCHAGQDYQLMYLHSILTFILLRYKETLLEARGFERTQVNSSDLRKNEAFDPEEAYSRHIQITGYVRQMWPKAVDARITTVAMTPLLATRSDEPGGIEVVEVELDLDQDALTARPA